MPAQQVWPVGLSTYGTPIFTGVPATLGVTFFVNSVGGVDTNLGTDPAAPLATINKGIANATASRNDVIVVAAGHSESISGAASIAANKAGVSIVGLGTGPARPKITLHTTDATIAVSAANILFRNLQILTDVDAVVKVFYVTAAGLTLDAVDFVETTSCACLQFVLTTAAGDDLTVQNCRWIQTGTAATALMSWIGLVGADRAKIVNNFCHLSGYASSNPANGVIVGATTLSGNVEIVGNRFIIINSTGNIPISLYTGTTGYVAYNIVSSTKTAIAGQVACASAYAAENYVNNTVNLSGLLDPTVDS